MESDQTNSNGGKKKEANVLPPTEIAKNPNPRANEIIKSVVPSPDGQLSNAESENGTEITDGEDG